MKCKVLQSVNGSDLEALLNSILQKWAGDVPPQFQVVPMGRNDQNTDYLYLVIVFIQEVN